MPAHWSHLGVLGGGSLRRATPKSGKWIPFMSHVVTSPVIRWGSQSSPNQQALFLDWTMRYFLLGGVTIRCFQNTSGNFHTQSWASRNRLPSWHPIKSSVKPCDTTHHQTTAPTTYPWHWPGASVWMLQATQVVPDSSWAATMPQNLEKKTRQLKIRLEKRYLYKFCFYLIQRCSYYK